MPTSFLETKPTGFHISADLSSNPQQQQLIKFDRIGIMLHGAQPHRGDQPWARDAFHVNMEYEYANNAGPRVYAGRPPRHERDAGG